MNAKRAYNCGKIPSSIRSIKSTETDFQVKNGK